MAEVTFGFFHVKVLAKAQVTKDIEDKPVDPVTHVDRCRPFTILCCLSSYQLQPSVHVGMKKHFGITQSSLRKCVVQHAALASVDTNSRTAPSVDRVNIAWPNAVVVTLPDVAFRSEYFLKRSWRV